MHLEDEHIQRVLHRELVAGLGATVSEHLAQCEECRRRVEEARHEEEWILGLVHRLEVAVPPLDADALLTRARTGTWAWGRWAAAVLLLAGAVGVAYAVPGSPLPDWVRRVVGRTGGPNQEPAAPARAITATAAGVAVPPGGHFTIVFRARQQSGGIAVSLVDGPYLALRTRNGAPPITTDLDGLTVENRGSSADYDLELPRGAPWVEIRTAGHRLFLKDGNRVITARPAEADGRYLIPLRP